MRPGRPTDIVNTFYALMLGGGLVAVAGPALAEDSGQSALAQQVKDAWIDGRLETAYALNTQLSPFDIDSEVEDGVVRLTGTLSSDIDRDLAIEIASGIEGVQEVTSTIAVDPGTTPAASDDDETRSFGQWVEDVTATARVKSNLVANGNTKGLSIDVDTENNVVTLKGAVTSRKEKMLAEMIARNTDGIVNVRNQLEIDEQS